MKKIIKIALLLGSIALLINCENLFSDGENEENDTTQLTFPMIYGCFDTGSKITRFSVDGGATENVLVSEVISPYGITFDPTGKKIYWTDYDSDTIRRANYDGTEIEDIVTSGLVQPAEISLNSNDNKIYWCDYGNNTVKRAGLDGADVETILSGADGIASPIGLTLDGNGHIFFTDEGTQNIYKADLDGSNLETIVTGSASPHGIVYNPDNQKIYWTNWVENEGTVQRCDSDGSNIETIVENLNWGMAMAIDIVEDKLFYTSEEGIFQCDYDGSNQTLLFTANHVPFIDFIPEE